MNVLCEPCSVGSWSQIKCNAPSGSQQTLKSYAVKWN